MTVAPTPIHARAPAPRSSFTIRKATELGAWGVCLAIYGPPGAGKTTFCADSADSEFGAPVLMIDAEGGARTVSHRSDVHVATITNEDGRGFQRVKDIYDALVRGDLKYGTILIDNMSELVAMCITHVVRTVQRGSNISDRPDIKDWSTITSELLVFTRKFRDYARNSGTNVLFIAWDKPRENPATHRVKQDLAFNPAFAESFPGIVDVVGYLTVEARGVRHLSFEASRTTAAKFRRSDNEVANNIPVEIRYRKVDKPLCDMLATLKGGRPWPARKYAGVPVAAAE